MELLEAIGLRHSVRSYKDEPIDGEIKNELISFIEQCNQESGLHMQLVLDEPKGFDCLMAHYGRFSGVKNYIALIGKKGAGLEEACGYYGEKVVLRAQQLGLNTCWVALTYKKVNEAFEIGPDEKLCLVISIGYGTTQGAARRSKPKEKVMAVKGTVPAWFDRGIEAALLAPTAMNQQKFLFSLSGNRVSAKAGMGFYSKVDLGIAKYHFEIGAGAGNFTWT